MQSITSAGRQDRPLHILEVIGNASYGGMERYITNFISQLPDKDFQVTCICPYESSFTTLLRNLGTEVYITPISDDPTWRSIQLTVEVAQLHETDVLHAHMPRAHVLAGLAGRLIHKPVVATVHGMDITSHELGITRLLGSQLITNCQEAYTQALAMGVPADRVSLIHNGVDTQLFTPNADGNEFRNSVNQPGDTPLIGFVGRLQYEKGPDMFLRSAHSIHHFRPDVRFVLVGEGEMKDELIEMCALLELNKNVSFVSWRNDMHNVYPGLDLLVHTSRSDGTSLSLLEAMACGCPVVALAVGGVREIVENESTGLLSGIGDWERIGDLILKLLAEPERLQKMGAAARSRVEKNFNLRTNTLCTSDILSRAALQGINIEKSLSNGTMAAEIGSNVSFGSSAAGVK